VQKQGLQEVLFCVKLWKRITNSIHCPGDMTDSQKSELYRFGVFEANAVTGELRRQGIRLKLNAQPFQVLVMLLERPGELLTRDEISRQLWPEGTFVDYEHGVNSAVNRIREALGDTAGSPRYVETLARRGYRFVAPVERPPRTAEIPVPIAAQEPASESFTTYSSVASTILASPQELQQLPAPSRRLSRPLFILLQLMYLGFYLGALANLGEIADLLSALPGAVQSLTVLIVTAAVLLPVRIFLLTSVAFRAPGLRQKFLRMWPLLLPLDELWALSPFLLLHHINFGVAFACTAILVYSPFAQRSLVLMGVDDWSVSNPADH
jgi:cholera toxin transcriptional activator